MQLKMVLSNRDHVKFVPTEREGAKGCNFPRTILVFSACCSNPEEIDEANGCGRNVLTLSMLVLIIYAFLFEVEGVVHRELLLPFIYSSTNSIHLDLLLKVLHTRTTVKKKELRKKYSN